MTEDPETQNPTDQAAINPNSDESWKILSLIHDWIKVADTKAAASLAASGVLGGICLKALPAWQDMPAAPWHYWLMLASCIAAGLSAFVALRVLAPRINNGHGESLIFFQDIALSNETSAIYSQKLNQRASEDGGSLASDTREQIWSNSRVAKQKFRRVGWAMRLLGLALLLAAISSFLGGLNV